MQWYLKYYKIEHPQINFYNIVMNLSKLTLHSLSEIPIDGDKTTLLDKLFQASTAPLLLKKYWRTSL